MEHATYYGDENTYNVAIVGKGYNSNTVKVKILECITGDGTIPRDAIVTVPKRSVR